MSLSELIAEVQRLKPEIPTVLGVNYVSRCNPNNSHYVVCRNVEEFKNLKRFYRDWDYSFHLIDC